MNNEIKEILDNLQYGGFCWKRIYDEEIKKILDYITNLQQENERLQENNKAMQIEMTITWKKVDDLQKRIEKAVEYIKEARKQDFMWSPIFMKELLNILNGRSDE